MRRRLLSRAILITAFSLAVLLGYWLTPAGHPIAPFLWGFVSASAFLTVFYFLFRAKQSATIQANHSNRLLAAFLVLTGGLITGILVYSLQQWSLTNDQARMEAAAHRSDQLESSRVAALMPLMSQLLDRAGEEVKSSPDRSLSRPTIARIIALSQALGPDIHLSEGIIPPRKRSRERGLLLQSLAGMNMDTSSMAQILAQGTFAGSEAPRAKLEGAFLKGADLRWANLREADLSGAVLEGADLRFSDLWSARIRKGNFKKARLDGANMAWALLDSACFRSAGMKGVQLHSARLVAADLSGAFAPSGNLSGANLTDALAKGTILESTDLSNALLAGTHFEHAQMRWTRFTGADMRKAKLTAALVAYEDWPERCLNWNIMGAEEIAQQFRAVHTIIEGAEYFILEPKSE